MPCDVPVIKIFNLIPAFVDIVKVFFSDIISFPFLDNPITNRREYNLHNKLCSSTCLSTGEALEISPAKTVPENRCKANKNDYRKYKIIKKLPYKGGNICSHCVSCFAVRVFPENSPGCKNEHITYNCRQKKCNGAS